MPAMMAFLQATGRRWCHVAVPGGLRVHKDIVSLVEQDLLPHTGVEAEQFWEGMGGLYSEMEADNAKLLEARAELQKKIDDYHKQNPKLDQGHYKEFLTSIGYLEPSVNGSFQIETKDVDPEISATPAPQLVCPVDNDRYIVNAANARWGSLLDALYGTNVIPGDVPKGSYQVSRGATVFAEVHRILDRIFPLTKDSWATLTKVSIAEGDGSPKRLEFISGASTKTELKSPSAFKGYLANPDGSLSSILLQNNGLHMEVKLDRTHHLGEAHPLGMTDVIVESALSVIADAEDSACTVDAEDKVVAYSNWANLMKGSISVPITKGGQSFARMLDLPRTWSPADPALDEIRIPGRAVLMCRNVGIHMYTDIVKSGASETTPEHFLDAMVTAVAAMHDKSSMCNSRTSAIYLVKPKMHGSAEVKFVVKMFTKVEEVLGLPKNTIKMGIMDEERRTSCNLNQAMYEARERLFFINTGFLDRCADEIHTSMQMGPMPPKEEIRHVQWIKSYEASNVDNGLSLNLNGCGQIGKGMWAAPDEMQEMMDKKIGHLQAGATTSWVPSPTAATLHALHYHYTDVKAVQSDMKSKTTQHIDGLIQPPALDRELTPREVQAELDCNVQSLLGYVVRWVGLGVGCSKVPDTNNVQLMEDRATLRISSQHIANWLHHKIVTVDQVERTMKRMAQVVDQQNAGTPGYVPMAPTFTTIEFNAARDLIFNGVNTPNGYTEGVLSSRRRERKAVIRAQSA